MLGLFRKDNSKNVAKERLKLVLISDRLNSSSAIIEQMKLDIIKVISKYMDIDETDIDLQITDEDADGGHQVSANFPLKNLKNNKDD